MIKLNTLAQEIHIANKAKGFYDTPTETGTRLMMVVGELGEAMEALRKNNHADIQGYLERKREILESCIKMPQEELIRCFETRMKDTFSDEIADAIIRLLDLATYEGINLEVAIQDKLNYNKTRPYKHGKTM
jgi:NTP pyrophosphatase (non-canonical NTP hydrolase)